jgi:protein SOK2
MNGSQGASSMSMDNGLNGARSMPNTPAATPPGSIQSMQSYPSAAQGYDSQRQMYNAPSAQHSPYQNSANPPPDRLYSQPGSYAKSEMGPPASRPPATISSGEQPDNKGPNEQQSQNHPEEEGEHEAEYTHDSASYDHARAPYNYNNGAGVASMSNEANMPSEMANSQNHPPASGRATPRTAAPPQPYYQHHTGYNSPQRVQQSTSNLYNVMTSDRAPTNGAPGNDVYAPPTDMSSSMSNGYATQPPVMNGSASGMKRGRDDEDDIVRPTSDEMGNLDLKRRKTMMETTVSAPTYDAMSRPASAIAAPRRR